MVRANAEFSHEIERMLSAANINFTTEPKLEGVTPDFLVETDTGQQIVLEAKSWEPSPQNVRKAQEQADLYKSATGANYAFVVVPSVPTYSGGSVVGIADLVDRLSSLDPDGGVTSIGFAEGVIFAAMPLVRPMTMFTSTR